MNASLRIVALTALVPAIVLTACSSGSKPKNGTATANATPTGARATTPSGSDVGVQPGQAADGTPTTTGAAPQASAASGDVPPNTNAADATPAYAFSSPQPPAPFEPALPPPIADTTPTAPTPPSSPAITIGAPSSVSGAVNVPVGIIGSGLTPFTAFSVHLRWDPRVFKFASANSAGTVLPGSVFCAPVQVDADGGGAMLGCTALGRAEATSAGLLATFILSPVGTGCSVLHLFTYHGVDGGDNSTGTATLDADAKIQLTATIDGRIDQAGQVC